MNTQKNPYKLNDHNEDCPFYSHLKEMLRLNEKYGNIEFEFLINYTNYPIYTVWDFLENNKLSDKPILAYHDVYDGFKEFNIINLYNNKKRYKFRKTKDVLFNITFQISKQLRRIEALLKNNSCFYCKNLLDTNLCSVDIIPTKKDLEFLRNMEFQEFLVFIKKIDFLIGREKR